jgi:hypothetical protein
VTRLVAAATWAGPDFCFALVCAAVGLWLFLRALLDKKLVGRFVAGFVGVALVAFAVLILIVTKGTSR